MPCFYLRSIANPPISYGPSTLLGPILASTNDGHSPPTMLYMNYQVFVSNSLSKAFAFACSVSRVQCAGTLQLTVSDVKPPKFGLPQPQLSMGSPRDIAKTSPCGNTESPSSSDCAKESAKKTAKKERKEMHRRRKIGEANKGKIPWNKGRKHSAETCERIKQRTLEALRDPKVRRKMSEWPRAHSDQSKARIGIALRRIWGERLKEKRLQERCYLEWAESIAEEARAGGHGQQELEWDSYEKMKAAIILELVQRAEEKLKANEMAKVRAKELAKARAADRKAKIAQAREEASKKEKAEMAIKKNIERKSKEEKKELAISRALKIKARLSKMKVMDGSRDSSIGMGVEPVLEKWDMEFVKRERMRRSVSLADQIRAANNKKAEFAIMEAPKATSSDDLFPREEG